MILLTEQIKSEQLGKNKRFEGGGGVVFCSEQNYMLLWCQEGNYEAWVGERFWTGEVEGLLFWIAFRFWVYAYIASFPPFFLLIDSFC